MSTHYWELTESDGLTPEQAMFNRKLRRLTMMTDEQRCAAIKRTVKLLYNGNTQG